MRRELFAVLTLCCVLGCRAQTNSLVIAVDRRADCLLGGSESGRWISDDAAAARLKGGERYRLYGPDIKPGTVTGGKPASVGPPCRGTLSVDFTPPLAEQARVLAVSGTEPPEPRGVRDILPESSRYGGRLAPVLARHQLAGAAAVRQLLAADLDGDGTEEIVGVVSNIGEGGAAARVQGPRYSGLFVLRANAADEPLTAEFEREPVEGGITTHSISQILDLNGDGKLEIFLYGRSDTAEHTNVYGLEGQALRRVLGCGCGD